MIRAKYSMEGYVLELSGTPAPKMPVDWWSLTEIAWPGFLRRRECKGNGTETCLPSRTNV